MAKKEKPRELNFIKATERKARNEFVHPKRLANSRRKELINNITIYEKHIMSLLDDMKITYKFQHILFINRYQFYILDFYLPEQDACIELDGKHHKDNPEQLEHDKTRDLAVYSKNIMTYRLLNTDAIKLDKKEFKKLIEKITSDYYHLNLDR